MLKFPDGTQEVWDGFLVVNYIEQSIIRLADNWILLRSGRPCSPDGKDALPFRLKLSTETRLRTDLLLQKN